MTAVVLAGAVWGLRCLPPDAVRGDLGAAGGASGGMDAGGPDAEGASTSSSSGMGGASTDPVVLTDDGTYLCDNCGPAPGCGPLTDGGATLDYNGGLILPDPHVVPMWWQDPDSHAPFMDDFYKTAVDADGGSHGFMALMAEYGDMGGDKVGPHGTTTPRLVLDVADATTLPTTCTDGPVAQRVVAEYTAVSVLTKKILAGALPMPDANTYYPIHFPADVCMNGCTCGHGWHGVADCSATPGSGFNLGDPGFDGTLDPGCPVGASSPDVPDYGRCWSTTGDAGGSPAIVQDGGNSVLSLCGHSSCSQTLGQSVVVQACGQPNQPMLTFKAAAQNLAPGSALEVYARHLDLIGAADEYGEWSWSGWSKVYPPAGAPPLGPSLTPVSVPVGGGTVKAPNSFRGKWTEISFQATTTTGSTTFLVDDVLLANSHDIGTVVYGLITYGSNFKAVGPYDAADEQRAYLTLLSSNLLACAITDPFFDGWITWSYCAGEIPDLCNGNSQMHYAPFCIQGSDSTLFRVVPLWSQAKKHCQAPPRPVPACP